MTEEIPQKEESESEESRGGNLRDSQRGEVSIGDMHLFRTKVTPGIVEPVKNEKLYTPCDTKCLLAVMRVAFGAIFLFDGMLKWYLLATNQMGMVMTSSMIYYQPAWLVANAVPIGIVIGLGETMGGLFLILGVFQRPAAAWSFLICTSIWIMGGFGGFPNAVGVTWSTAMYTDVGGDLMLALVYLFLAFAPSTYGLASYLRLSERFASGNRMWDRFVRTMLA